MAFGELALDIDPENFPRMTRLPTAILAGLVLLASGLDYAWIADNSEDGWRWCLRAPIERQGSDLVFPLWRVTGIDDAHHYRISGFVKDVPVDGDATSLTVGATVSVLATFDWNDGAPIARQTWFELHRLRAWKEALGIAGFLIISALLPFCFLVIRDEHGRRYVTERTGWPNPTERRDG